MWWHRPLLVGQRPTFPEPGIIEVIARSFAVVHVGGIQGLGAERGRAFERIFYALCERCGLRLTERAGARTVAGQRSASGFAHEVDGAMRSASCISHWELKHLNGAVPKNELLIFNGKGIDFLYGSDRLIARTPVYRFLLSGGDVRHECRTYAVLWGINVIEPDLLPLALLCEAVARGLVGDLSSAEIEAVNNQGRSACRDLQSVLRDISAWTGMTPATRLGDAARLLCNEILDLQEQLGRIAFDCIDERFPDWLDELAEDTWHLVGGW